MKKALISTIAIPLLLPERAKQSNLRKEENYRQKR